jgi:hypothetical protein
MNYESLPIALNLGYDMFCQTYRSFFVSYDDFRNETGWLREQFAKPVASKRHAGMPLRATTALTTPRS